jgi:CheY-like chemotaxis protein
MPNLPSPPPRSLRVLVVDDEHDTADSMKVILEHWGQEVRVAYDGLSAVDLARVFRPHIALLDIGLPGLDGWQVAEAMRESPATETAFLLAVTGYSTRDDIERSHAKGFHGHVLKPVSPQLIWKLLWRIGNSLPDEGMGRNGKTRPRHL